MKKKKILFIGNKEKGMIQKKQDRETVIKYFEKLSEKNPDNNVISEKMLKILPEVDQIIIPEDDLNRKNPYILYRINESTRMMEIPRCHKICWNKLMELVGKKN